MAANGRSSPRMPVEMSKELDYYHENFDVTYDEMAKFLGMSKSFFCKVRHFDKGVPDKYWPKIYELLNELSKKQKEKEK